MTSLLRCIHKSIIWGVVLLTNVFSSMGRIGIILKEFEFKLWIFVLTENFRSANNKIVKQSANRTTSTTILFIITYFQFIAQLSDLCTVSASWSAQFWMLNWRTIKLYLRSLITFKSRRHTQDGSVTMTDLLLLKLLVRYQLNTGITE